MRQRLFLFFCGIMTLFLFGCIIGPNPSPHFASVEVIDENGLFIEGCEFSALYDGQNDSEFDVHLDSDEGETDESKIFPVFKSRPCRYYDLFSNRFAADCEMPHSVEDLIKKFRISVSKEGYETVEFTPTLQPDEIVIYALDSIVLKKLSDTSDANKNL